MTFIQLMPLPLAVVNIHQLPVLQIPVAVHAVPPTLRPDADLLTVEGALLPSLSMEGRLTVQNSLHAQDVEVLISTFTVDVVALGHVQDPPTVISTQLIGLPPVAAMILLPHVPTVPDL